MRSTRTLAFALLLSVTPAGAVAAQSRNPATDSLRLRPGDGLRLLVRDEPTLSGDFPIVESGDVMLPEVGLVPVGGRPFVDVVSDVRDAVARDVVDAQVVVVPLVRVAVIGEVRRPGLFTVDPTQTMADLLASAGGLTPSGSLSGITLVRDGEDVRLKLGPDEPALGGPIRPGDKLLVGRRGWFSSNMPVLVGAGASVLAAAVTALLIR